MVATTTARRQPARRGPGITRPKGYYQQRIEYHKAAGRTRPLLADRSKHNLKVMKRKLDKRMCAEELDMTRKEYLRGLTADRIKAFFDWLKDTHINRIKCASTVSTYWRHLKMLFARENGRILDEEIRSDCLNYKNKVIKEWGLRRLPRRRPPGTKDNLYDILRFHWERCTRVYTDEKQRLYVSVIQLLAFISGCRPVSLLDTRVDAKKGTKRKRQMVEAKTRGVEPRQVKKRKVSSSRRSGSAVEVDVDSGSDPEYSSNGSSSDRVADVISDDYTDSLLGEEDALASDDYDSGYETGPNNNDVGFISEHFIDDAYDAGPEQTGALLWRHIELYLIRSPVPGRPNIPLAKVTFLHTKQEDRKPRVKTIFLSHHPDPMFDILGQLLSLAKHDNIFEANIQNLKDIYYYSIPENQPGEPLKIKAKSLDQPVFRRPERGPNGPRTSDTEPMDYQTFYDYLTKLGKARGLKHSLLMYAWRRGLINAINYKAPSSVRDQVADHESNAVKYYLDREVQFPLQAAALEFVSDEVVDKAARGLLLDADLTAPTELPHHLQEELDNDPEIMELIDKNSEIWEALKALGFRSVRSAKGRTPLYWEKKRVYAELTSRKVWLRNELMNQARSEHFRNAPTERLNTYLSGTAGDAANHQSPPLPRLLIEERQLIVELVRVKTSELSEDEILERRFACMDLWVRLQDRKETKRLGLQRKRHLRATKPSSIGAETVKHLQSSELSRFSTLVGVLIPVRAAPEKLHELQCPFCNADPGRDYEAQCKIWDKPYRLWRHIEQIHSLELEAYSTGKKPCGLCIRKKVSYVPESIMEFTRHTFDVHGPRLRGV
ncbi:hypothetical protein BDBG_03695 [Blastomyces gilchristii SLH14081]|uniref:FluG domain-containing protein n=1 Tax=Blastomyces gilchristii (strain SLH14081) TaxID=559298 RepID=A0A179UHX9_BLAGS|nr:uncharacterized protein BDBG_03695 [Blastomyces gilchristii SLH14081]OAT07656.1 hypothetical protein BDBG_03695 [Blastomyces gilchristii SLH14081]